MSELCPLRLRTFGSGARSGTLPCNIVPVPSTIASGVRAFLYQPLGLLRHSQNVKLHSPRSCQWSTGHDSIETRSPTLAAPPSGGRAGSPQAPPPPERAHRERPRTGPGDGRRVWKHRSRNEPSTDGSVLLRVSTAPQSRTACDASKLNHPAPPAPFAPLRTLRSRTLRGRSVHARCPAPQKPDRGTQGRTQEQPSTARHGCERARGRARARASWPYSAASVRSSMFHLQRVPSRHTNSIRPPQSLPFSPAQPTRRRVDTFGAPPAASRTYIAHDRRRWREAT